MFKIAYIFENIKIKLINNKKVIENYFFMTLLQILNSLFYFIIYPFLIRRLGAYSYGSYVYAFSISVFFLSFVQFGFDTPALKVIALNPKDKVIHSETISSVFICKSLLSILSTFIFVILLYIIPVFKTNHWLFFVCYLQIFSNILFPTWYFQGIQKMRVVTYIQLILKLLSLPLILLVIKNPKDVIYFALITVFTSLISGAIAIIILINNHSIKFIWIPIYKLKVTFKEATPFFLSSSMNIIKQQSATILLGSFFSMRDVALYDLAMKIYTVPTTLVSSINSALFPKMISSKWKEINDVIKLENIIGLFIMFGLVIFGKSIIIVMGGVGMLESYPILIILSFSVFTILTVGAIFNFVFIPKGLYKYVAINQFIALSGFILFSLIGLIFFFDRLVLPLAFAFAALLEFSYSYYLLNKYKNDFR
jgi:PST family polysaccharide transporter